MARRLTSMKNCCRSTRKIFAPTAISERFIFCSASSIRPPHFYNAVRIHPTDLVSNMNLAGLFLAQGKWGQSRLQLQTVLEIDPDHAAAKEMLTRVKEQEA